MTPPCLNCHVNRDTPPDLSNHPRLSWNPLQSNPAPMPFPLPVCSIEPQWPDWLKKSFPDMQQRTWWARANFEAARKTKAQVEGVTLAPMRINVGSAQLETSLKFALGEHSLFKVRGFDVADLMLGMGAQAHGVLLVQDNGLVLRGPNNAAGNPSPLDLFNFTGIDIDAPATFNFSPHRITVGDWGEVHFILQPTSTYRFLLDPYSIPKPALGHDFPTDQQMELKGQDWISTPVEQPNPKNNPDTDLTLTQFIPADFLEADGRLPENYNLEVLTARVIDYLAKKPKPAQPSQLKLSEVLEYFEAGSKIDLKLDALKDLLLPGVLDLGPSNLQASVELTEEKLIDVKVAELNLQLDPMDYPAAPGETRPPIHLLGGNIQAAPAFVTAEQRRIEPGLHVVFDPTSGIADITANIYLQASLELPALGAVQVDARVVLETRMLKTEQGLKLFPRTTTLNIQNLTVERTGDKPALLANLNLSFTDDEYKVPEMLRWEHERPGSALATFSVNGQVGAGDWLDLNGHIPLPKGADGAYDLTRILEGLPLQATAFLSHGKSNYETHISLSSLRPDLYGLDPINDQNLLLKVDIDHHGPEQGIAGAKYSTEPFIKGGELYVKRSRDGLSVNRWAASLGVGLLKLEGLLSDLGVHNKELKNLELKNLQADLQLEHVKYADEAVEVRIPVLRVAADGSKQGPVRGSLRIEQMSGTKPGIDIQWNTHTKRLEFSGVNIALSAQQIDVLPPPIKRLLNKRVATLGVDGHIEGKFSMNFPTDKKDWNGAGKLTLRGDPQGDVYFLDAGGHQVGPAFIRDTRWEFRRIDWINLKRQYALGDFYLDIIMNMGALLPEQPVPDPDAIPVFGAHGQPLQPFEINGVMPYDNMPWSGVGFKNRIVDYILALCRKDAECSKSMAGGGGKKAAP